MLGRVELRMLVPDGQEDKAARFQPGARLVTTEGPRPTESCTVLSVPRSEQRAQSIREWQHGSRN